MTAPSHALADRLAKLERLGEQVDQSAAAWLIQENPTEPADALHRMDEARRLIELTVDLAMAEGMALSPALTQMRAEWEARFSRLAQAITQRQQALSADARLRIQQNHAAQAYLRHA